MKNRKQELETELKELGVAYAKGQTTMSINQYSDRVYALNQSIRNLDYERNKLD